MLYPAVMVAPVQKDILSDVLDINKLGFLKKEVVKRDIISKRMPKKVSTVRNQPVSSMNEEYVIVMEKI